MKGRLVKAIVILLVAAGVGFGGYYGYNKYFAKKTAAAVTDQYYAVSVRTMNLSFSVQGTGAAYAAVTKDVLPNNNGTIQGLTVKVGDTVAAGQTLFVSESDDVRKNVTTAKNNLAKQNLTLANDQNSEKVDENKVALDKISVSDAQAQLDSANKQLTNMTVKAPIGGVVTAVNFSSGDTAQTSKAVLTIVDMNSIRIKVSVDELDIEKVKLGQQAQIKFDAIKDKTYEGTVETISQIGNTSNNVTTYDVIVGVKDPSGIRLGMNGNVTILVESKENVLVIPAEALIDNNGQKSARVESTGTTADNSGQAAGGNGQAGNGQTTQTNSQNQSGSTQSGTQAGSSKGNRAVTTTTGSSSRLVAIKTGMETQNYIEVTEGLTAGQSVLVQLPQVSSTTTTNSTNRNNLGGLGGNMGNLGGSMGGTKPQRNNSGTGN